MVVVSVEFLQSSAYVRWDARFPEDLHHPTPAKRQESSGEVKQDSTRPGLRPPQCEDLTRQVDDVPQQRPAADKASLDRRYLLLQFATRIDH